MVTRNLVELFIYSKKMSSKDGKKTWIKYSTKANFLVKCEDGKMTKALHYIDVKFTKDAFEDSEVKLTDIKRGKLLVDGKFIGLPTKYEIVEKEDGTREYPICYIRGGIESFTPVVKEHQFDFVVDDNEATDEVEDTQE